jgi:hypothetical protein
LQNADGDAGDRASAVSFQVKLAFEALIDRFDALPKRA